MVIALDTRRKLSFAVILLFSAIVFQFVIIYYVQDDVGYEENLPVNADAESAIKRARTAQCKEELERFGLDHREELPLTLARRCPRDNNRVNRVVKLGCRTVSLNSSSSSSRPFVAIGVQPESEQCVESCFSYGHTHAGYNSANKECWCTDHLDELVQPEEPTSLECNLEWYLINNGIYTPTVQDSSPVQDRRNIRILFLISLNGRSVLQVQRLLYNIYSSKHFYLIHVDSRQEYIHDKLFQSYKNASNIKFARRRYETIWGGTTLLTMMIDAMDQMKHQDWDFMINLSETDFPIKSTHKLTEYLAHRNPGTIYLRSHNMKGFKFIRKQGLSYNFYQCESRVWRLGGRQLPRGIVFSGGSDWVALPKRFCDYILSERLYDNSLTSSLLQLYNFTLLPAESFFHTLALNSEFCDKYVDNNLRVTNWHRKQGCKCQHKQVVDWCGCSPLVYRQSDRPRLEQTNSSSSLFFSRKFDPTISASVVGLVENMIQHKEGDSTDSRYWLNAYELPGDTIVRAQECFGRLVRENLKSSEHSTNYTKFIKDNELIDLQSVDLHFSQDQFVGFLYRYCPLVSGLCEQLLVERKPGSNLERLKRECLKSEDRQLLMLEVNQGFDTGERMFRNYMPLTTNSDIVVQHEWSVVRPRIDAEPRGPILFKWLDPNGRVELVQEIKLKMTDRPNRLSLVHRLVHERPLTAGLWSLIVIDDLEECVKYSFLVLDSSSCSLPGSDGDDDLHMIHNPGLRAAFRKLFKVTGRCREATQADHAGDDCRQAEWSLAARDKVAESYRLTNRN